MWCTLCFLDAYVYCSAQVWAVAGDEMSYDGMCTVDMPLQLPGPLGLHEEK
jgi:hypothetical protein